MKCHYEVLSVARDASDSEIKTAYRKLALQWHPDKNLDQVEEAKEQFQQIQQAYEVLSDPQERAWYDNHREQILRGKNSNYEDNSLDLFQYFSASCFKGYGDDPGGFYRVYGEVFEKIRAEDAEFMEDEEDIEAIPTFGDSQSSYEDVVGPFYAYWQSYCTKKSYAWLCPYDITEIKDRRVLREIEKDMKKVVQKARKERNEEVRNLVAFVRKRDKRVQANKRLLEERAAMNRLKQEQNRLEQIRRRRKELEEHHKNQSHHHNNDEYEEQLRQLDQEYAGLDDVSDEDSSEEADELADSIGEVDIEESLEDFADELYCVACNKAFKNVNAFLNHETSKKHRENVDRLKREMLGDEQAFVNAAQNASNGCDNSEAEADEIKEAEQEESLPESKSRGKKSKKNRRNKVELNDGNDEEETIPDLLNDLAKEQDDWCDDKKTKKNKSKKGVPKAGASVKASKPCEEVTSKDAPAPKETPELDTNHSCVTCKSSFQSKNKLFQHLKATGHGVYIPKGSPAPDATKKKGKRNK